MKPNWSNFFNCRSAAMIAVCQPFVVHSMCKVEIQKSITSLQNVFHILIHYMQAIILYMQAKSLYMQAIFLYAKKIKFICPLQSISCLRFQKGFKSRSHLFKYLILKHLLLGSTCHKVPVSSKLKTTTTSMNLQPPNYFVKESTVDTPLRVREAPLWKVSPTFGNCQLELDGALFIIHMLSPFFRLLKSQCFRPAVQQLQHWEATTLQPQPQQQR